MNPQSQSALTKLIRAVSAGRSEAYCLRLWSAFIRNRDGGRCVLCHRRKRLSAHHILRKSLIYYAQFDPGNGITLCANCHRLPHKGFNRRPDLLLPIDAQEGEKLDLATRLFLALIVDANARGQLTDDLYFVNPHTLATLKRMQVIPEDVSFPGPSLVQAFHIMKQTPRPVLEWLLKANGVAMPPNLCQLGNVTTIEDGTVAIFSF